MDAERRAINALKGGRVMEVEIIEGRPGGPNNDAVILALDNGCVVRIDAYSGGDMTVTRAK